MNREGLLALLVAERVRLDSFSIDGSEKDESLCLQIVEGGWAVYYAERGLRSGERRFHTEDEACDFMARRLLADEGNRIDGHR